MTEVFAPIGMTIGGDIVKGTQQPGYPGRPRTAPIEPAPPSVSIPKLREIANDPATAEAYYQTDVLSDPRYRLGVEIDYALNHVDDWPIVHATNIAFSRALRAWHTLGDVSPNLTDEEWRHIVGKRNLQKPANITRVEAMHWVQMYDSELVLQKIERGGRNPYIQMLVGSVIGGLIDPVNVAVAGLSALFTPVVGGAVESLLGPAAANATRTGFGSSLLRHPIVTTGSRLFGETSVAVGLDSAIVEKFGEDVSAEDAAATFATMGVFSLLGVGARKAIAKLKSRMSPSEVIAANAKVHAVVDGMPDADLIDAPLVDEYVRGEAIDDIPVNTGKPHVSKNPFQADVIRAFDKGPEVEAVLPPKKTDRRIPSIMGEIARRNTVDSAKPIWERVQAKMEAEGLIQADNPLSPAPKDIMRLVVAQFVRNNKNVLSAVDQAIRRVAKQVPKDKLFQGTRILNVIRKNNLTAAQVRKIVYDVMTRSGVNADDAQNLVKELSRDEAASWLNSIVHSGRGLGVSDSTPFANVASVIKKDPPPIRGSRVVKNVHKALWYAAENPKMADVMFQWLHRINVDVGNKEFFRSAFSEAGERYRGQINAGMRARPLEILDEVLRQEPHEEFHKPPEARAREVAQAVKNGEPVYPRDAVPLKTLVGREDLATPTISAALRAEIDRIVSTGHVGELPLEAADRDALSDLAVSVDNLTKAMRLCVRK